MKPEPLRLALAGVLAAALAAATALVPQASAGEGRRLQLALRDDPSLPIDAGIPRRRRPEPAPTVSPFALPTSPIILAPEDTQRPGASPGGSEFPPYEEELLRLAEILGAVHYLRRLCGAEEGSLWRDKMEELIAAEAPNPAWRARLVASFNAGYQGFDRTYRRCTPSAAQAVDLYLAEGRELTGVIKTRYSD